MTSPTSKCRNALLNLKFTHISNGGRLTENCSSRFAVSREEFDAKCLYCDIKSLHVIHVLLCQIGFLVTFQILSQKCLTVSYKLTCFFVPQLSYLIVNLYADLIINCIALTSPDGELSLEVGFIYLFIYLFAF